MADRDPAEQQLDSRRTDDPTTTKSATRSKSKKDPNLRDSIGTAIDNQSEVDPDDYPDKARLKP